MKTKILSSLFLLFLSVGQTALADVAGAQLALDNLGVPGSKIQSTPVFNVQNYVNSSGLQLLRTQMSLAWMPVGATIDCADNMGGWVWGVYHPNIYYDVANGIGNLTTLEYQNINSAACQSIAEAAVGFSIGNDKNNITSANMFVWLTYMFNSGYNNNVKSSSMNGNGPIFSGYELGTGLFGAVNQGSVDLIQVSTRSPLPIPLTMSSSASVDLGAAAYNAKMIYNNAQGGFYYYSSLNPAVTMGFSGLIPSPLLGTNYANAAYLRDNTRMGFNYDGTANVIYTIGAYGILPGGSAHPKVGVTQYVTRYGNGANRTCYGC
jgi:hypothetical protein